jgi:hypothetical protein
MTTYILLLLFSTIFAYFADIKFNINRKHSIFFIVAIVVLFTIIAGFRDFGIGIDTNIYIESYFNIAKSLQSFNDFLSIEYQDKGFLLLCWICSLISDDVQVVLVIIELWIISFTMSGAFMFKKKYDLKLWIFVFLYFFMFFGYSINLMRQFCAISLLFWGLNFFLDGKWKFFIIVQFIAFTFHSSSLIFLLVPIIILISKLKNIYIRNLITITTITAFGVILTSFFYYLTILGNLGLLSEIYSDRYGQNSEFESTSGLSYFIIISYLITFFLMFLVYKKKILNSGDTYILITLYLFSFLLLQLRYLTPYLERLSFYIGIICLVFLSNVLANKKIPLWLRISFVSFTIILCYRIFVVNLGAEIYPYASKILGI